MPNQWWMELLARVFSTAGGQLLRRASRSQPIFSALSIFGYRQLRGIQTDAFAVAVRDRTHGWLIGSLSGDPSQAIHDCLGTSSLALGQQK
jgi:hypothetical protein